MTHISDAISQCEREAEQAREQLRSSIEQLKQNLSPGPLANELMSTGATGGEALMNKIAHTAKENPLAVLLIGLGAALLLAPRGGSSRRAAAGRSETLDHDARRATSRLTRPIAKASEKVSGMMSSLGETAEDLGSRAADAAQNVAETTRDYASSGARYAKDQADAVGSSLSGARRTLRDVIDDQPLIVAAIGVAVGAALGSVLPVSRAERHFLGAASANVKRTAADLASDQYERVKTAAQEAVEDVKNAAVGAMTPVAKSDAPREAAPRSSRESPQASKEPPQTSKSGARGYEGPSPSGLAGASRSAGSSPDRRAV